jgi:nucleotide-binding universal stress UspA family protein
MGEVVPHVIEIIQAENIGTVVLGSHGQGHHVLRHLLLGSTTEKVLRSVPCPVYVVRHPNRKSAV